MLQLRKFFGASSVPDPGSAKSGAVKDSPPLPRASPVGDRDVMAEGARHFAAGRYGEALALVDEALESTPSDATLLFARASTLFAWGRFHEALQGFERARAAGMVDFDLDMQLGWTYLRLQRPAEAEAHFRNAAAVNPDSEEAYVAMANLLEMRGALPAQASDFEQHLSRWPKNYNGLMLLAACRFHQNDREGGTAAFREAISVDPTRSRAWWNLGVVLGHDEQYAEGLKALQRAFEIDTANGESESVLNFATALREDGRHEEALKLLERDLVRNPDPREHWLRSVFLLEAGRFTEGWEEHEFRWMREPLASARWTVRRPVWGGQELRGKTILLHAEQGFGDAIQFIRYARLLKERGARVIFGAFKDFDEISHDFGDIDDVQVGAPTSSYDYHIPLLSLPRVLGTTLGSIPAHVPYVKIHPAYLERWAQRIGATEKLKVGIVWAGNPKHGRDRMRSIPLARLSCLGRIEGLQLYSLQKSATAAVDIAASSLDLVDLGQDFENFRDTAAAISHLDLVISVDTSVAHLAGALAKPVWLMLPEPADWRWLLEGNRTPWYPTMRLFRQSERDRWDAVVDGVECALRNLTGSRNDGALTSKDAFDEPAAAELTRSQSVRGDPGDTSRHANFCRVDETRYGIVQYPPQPSQIADSLRYYGEYLHPQLELMRRFIRPGAWALDADVGIGISTLFLAESVGNNGHVLACESDPLLNQLARQNVAANRISNVTLLMRTVGERPVEGARSDNTSGKQSDMMDTIDGLGLERLDWIRINNGARCRGILEGAEATLWRLRPWIFISAASDDELHESVRATRDSGYQSWRVSTPLFNPGNYNERTDDMFPGKAALGLLSIPEEIEMDVEIEGCVPFGSMS